jgi:hypothetical protein
MKFENLWNKLRIELKRKKRDDLSVCLSVSLSLNYLLKWVLMANHIIAGKHYSTGLAGNQLYSIGGDVLNLTSRTSKQLLIAIILNFLLHY